MYLTVEDIKNSRVAALKELPDEFIVKRLIDLSRVIDEYCNTKFIPTGTEWTTDLRRKIKTLKKPLLHVDELKVFGVTLVENEDYYVYPEKNAIEFEDISKYQKRKKAVYIKYTYGYEEIPAIVKEVLLELFKESIVNANNIYRVKSEQWEDYSYTLADNTETMQNILSRLDRFIEDDANIAEESSNKVRAMLL
ncbi:hypothetical protein [Tepidimicrobium xylanilyticum]|uniref:Uncharacterized protein n=1 Tax=Tepidimicrobium xylanilyticum TaxID=1123352 RepID=A0A1H3EJG0_9FIRM|nr:hypothetical protein [Tepidimicrobium xylanilyticum]GMG96251.1 hypothetical protein EN5CB1_10770 [Tepidimicrobium xylanilyticum]SDX78727.1 hypothetical protein SAMN05660923_02932 [Tepidimicrobium xylanilyticum]